MKQLRLLPQSQIEEISRPSNTFCATVTNVNRINMATSLTFALRHYYYRFSSRRNQPNANSNAVQLSSTAPPYLLSSLTNSRQAVESKLVLRNKNRTSCERENPSNRSRQPHPCERFQLAGLKNVPATNTI